MSNCQPGICRNPLHDHPFDRTTPMTPKTDSVAVLRECPFCGSGVDLCGVPESGYFIACRNDECCMANKGRWGAGEVAAAWNQRVAPAQACGTVRIRDGFVFLDANPEELAAARRAGHGTKLYTAPGGVGDAVTEEVSSVMPNAALGLTDETTKFLIYRLRQIVAGGPLAYDAIAIDEAADLLTALAARTGKGEGDVR